MKRSRSIYCFIPVLLIAGLSVVACKPPVTQNQNPPPPPPKVETKKEVVNTDLDLLISGAPTMNRDAQGNALSVVLNIYQLKNQEAFNRLTLEMTYADQFEQEHLGDTLLSKTECVVTPKEKKGMKLKLNPETKYVGAIAFYRNPDKHHWRGIAEVQEMVAPPTLPTPQIAEPKTQKTPIKPKTGRGGKNTGLTEQAKPDPGPQTPQLPPPPPKDTQIRIQLHDCYLEFINPKPEAIPGVPTGYKPACAQ